MRVLSPGMDLVIASHNRGKVREIAELLQPFELRVLSAADLGLVEPEETGTTFRANAALKAEVAAGAANLPALADDSGLEVDALDGAPGIYSARWAGPGKDFDLAMAKVHDELAARDCTTPAQRRANFICLLCLAWPDDDLQFFEGSVHGQIVQPARGGNGFGYDPIFCPDGHQLTFGEMDPTAKHSLSHRAIAFKKFVNASFPHTSN